MHPRVSEKPESTEHLRVILLTVSCALFCYCFLFPVIFWRSWNRFFRSGTRPRVPIQQPTASVDVLCARWREAPMGRLSRRGGGRGGETRRHGEVSGPAGARGQDEPRAGGRGASAAQRGDGEAATPACGGAGGGGQQARGRAACALAQLPARARYPPRSRSAVQLNLFVLLCELRFAWLVARRQGRAGNGLDSRADVGRRGTCMRTSSVGEGVACAMGEVLIHSCSNYLGRCWRGRNVLPLCKTTAVGVEECTPITGAPNTAR